MSRIPLSTGLKTRTGAPAGKDARINNAYVEVKGEDSVVRKRPSAQGGISVGSGTAQGMIGFNIGGVDKIIGVWGDTLTNYTGGGTSWAVGTSYSIGDHVSYGFVDYWATTAHSGSQPPSANWSSSYVPAVPVPLSWTQRNLSAPRTWRDICWNGSFYCAVSDDGYSAVSTDGISWTVSAFPAGGSGATGVAWNGTILCAVGSVGASYNAFTSTDGINWTGRLISGASGGEMSISSNGTIFCVVDSNTISATFTATSSDGITWSTGSITASTWYSITYGGGKFVVVGNNTTPAYSIDGLNWSYGTGGISSLDVVYGGGIFVSVPRNGLVTKVSNDGITWSSGALNNSGFWSCIAYNGTKFVAIDASRATATDISEYSTDGINWTQVQLPQSTNWTGIASNGSNFCAVAYNTSIGATTP